MQLTLNGKVYTEFEIIELDVWGNKRDGFEVNDLYASSRYIYLSEDASAREIIIKLKRANVIKRNIRHTSLDVNFDCEYMIFVDNARTGEPCVQLHATKESI